MFMRKVILVFAVLGFMGLQNGCAPHPGSDLLFPKGNGAKMVTTGAQFDEMAGNSEKYLGHETMLAGAVMSIDHTDEGYFALAKWLPYPKTQADKGPVATGSDGNRHFLIRFVSKQKREFYTTRGNLFLLEGNVEGTKKALVKIFGNEENLLYVNAKCVHVWETGEEKISSGYAESEYAETRERTLCAD
jgi:hypothetical protein